MSKPSLIWEEEATSDPSIQGRTVRVRFVEGQFNFQTTINGTRDEIANYYCGARLNVASYPYEKFIIPNRLDFLPDSEGGQTVSYDLPQSKHQLYRGYTIDSHIHGCSFASVGIDGAEDSNDGRYGHCQTIKECKEAIDHQLIEAQWKDEPCDTKSL